MTASSFVPTKTTPFALALAAASLLALPLVACGDDHGDAHADGDEHDDHDGHGEGGYEGPASCKVFHDACVLAAAPGNAAAACEEVTHEEGLTEARCAEVRDGCVAACGATAGNDGGSPPADASVEGG